MENTPQEQNQPDKSWKHRRKSGYNNGACGWVYFLSVVGAAVYYIQQSEGFWMGVLGVLKAFVWPALVMHRLMEMWKM